MKDGSAVVAMFKRHAQLHDDEPDMESHVRRELTEALQSESVRRQLVEALDLPAIVARVLSDEKPQMLATLSSSLDLTARLSALINDPRVVQQLAAHIDVSAAMAGTGIRDRVRESLASSDLVEYAERVLPAARQRLQRRLGADPAFRSTAALAAGTWALAGVACWLYAALATEVCLTAFGWVMWLAFIRTTTFVWAWLTLPLHTIRIALAMAAAQHLPSIEDVIAALCAPPAAPIASQPSRASRMPAWRVLLSPLLQRLGTLGSLWVGCAAADVLAMIVRVFAFGYGDEPAAKVSRTVQDTSGTGSGHVFDRSRTCPNIPWDLASHCGRCEGQGMPERLRLALQCALRHALRSVRALGLYLRPYPPIFVLAPRQAILTLLLFAFLIVDAAPLLSWPVIRWALGARRAQAAEAAIMAPWDADPGVYESTGALGPASAGARAAVALSISAWRSVRGRGRRTPRPGAAPAAPVAAAAPASRNVARGVTSDLRAAGDWVGERV
jgi:hypothetical protein